MLHLFILCTSSLSRTRILSSYRVFWSDSSFWATSLAIWIPCIISSFAFKWASSISASSLGHRKVIGEFDLNQYYVLIEGGVTTKAFMCCFTLTALFERLVARFWRIQSLCGRHLHLSNMIPASQTVPLLDGWSGSSGPHQESPCHPGDRKRTD